MDVERPREDWRRKEAVARFRYDGSDNQGLVSLSVEESAPETNIERKVWKTAVVARWPE
jgi:hypothetical protein